MAYACERALYVNCNLKLAILSNFKCLHLYMNNFVPTKFIAISIYRVYVLHTATQQQQQQLSLAFQNEYSYTAIINFIFIVKFTHDLQNWNHYKGHLLRLHEKFIRKVCDKVKNIWTQSSSAKYLSSSMSFHHPFFLYHRKSCRDEYEKKFQVDWALVKKYVWCEGGGGGVA